MEKLKNLHSQVKNHIYRISLGQIGVESYRKLLYELTNEFGRLLFIDKNFKQVITIIHDFNWAIGNFDRMGKFGDESLVHLEMCLGVVHEYIDTDKITSFYVYRGLSKQFDFLPKESKYTFVESENKYYLNLNKNEMEKALSSDISNDIKEYLLECKNIFNI